MNRRQDNAIDRAKLAKKAKPLGDLIVAASRGTIPPPPNISGMEGTVRGKPPKGKANGKADRGDKGRDREAPVLHDCLRWLKKRGVFVWRNNSGTLWTSGQPVSFGYPGSPDIIGILPDGTFLGVECKSATGRQSAKQKQFEEKIRANGGLYILARSVEDVDRGLRLHENAVVPDDLPKQPDTRMG